MCLLCFDRWLECFWTASSYWKYLRMIFLYFFVFCSKLTALTCMPYNHFWFHNFMKPITEIQKLIHVRNLQHEEKKQLHEWCLTSSAKHCSRRGSVPWTSVTESKCTIWKPCEDCHMCSLTLELLDHTCQDCSRYHPNCFAHLQFTTDVTQPSVLLDSCLL